MAAQSKPADRPDPKYVVTTNYGPYTEGAVFARSEFARQFPLPDTAATRDSGLLAAGADQYHDDLLARALAAGAIKPADADAPSTPLEIGPENRTPPPGKAAAAPARLASDDAAQRSAADAVAAQKAADQKGRTADNKAEK